MLEEHGFEIHLCLQDCVLQFNVYFEMCFGSILFLFLILAFKICEVFFFFFLPSGSHVF